MCIIVHASDKGQFQDDQFEAYQWYHSDGVGAMWREGGKPFYAKFADSKRWPELLDMIPPETECAVHFRMATSGPVNADYAHPFDLLEGRGLLMHNGVIGGMGNDKESDTSEFCRRMLDGTPEFIDYALKATAKDEFCRFLHLGDKGFTPYGSWAEHQVTEDGGWISYSSEPNPGRVRYASAYGGSEWWNDAPIPTHGSGIPRIDEIDYKDLLDWIKRNPEEACGAMIDLYYDGWTEVQTIEDVGDPLEL